MMGEDDSNKIWQTIENMHRLDASLGNFDDILESRLGESFYFEWIHRMEGTHETKNEWACYAYWYACKLKQQINGRPQGRYIGAATFKIELWRPADAEDTAWHHPKTPLIYVAFSPDHKDWWGDFGLDQYGEPWDVDDVDIECPRPDSIWLWEWAKNDCQAQWQDRSWFFAVPLTALNSDESVSSELIMPLEGLVLEGRPPEEIFAKRHAIRGAAHRE